jgi:hypothetical protein
MDFLVLLARALIVGVLAGLVGGLIAGSIVGGVEYWIAARRRR